MTKRNNTNEEYKVESMQTEIFISNAVIAGKMSRRLQQQLRSKELVAKFSFLGIYINLLSDSIMWSSRLSICES